MSAINPYAGIGFIQFQLNPVYKPPADLYPGQQGPVPEGTVNGYGTALWIPNGYPIATQPYLDAYGRVILRPIRYTPGLNLNQATAYVLAALQYAVQKYSSSPYNVSNQTKLWSGPAVAQSYFIAPPTDRIGMQARLTMGSWDPDWSAPVFPQPTLADAAFNAGKAFVMSTFSAGLNQVVPGLGAQLENVINGVSKGGLSGSPDIFATPSSRQQQTQASTAAVSSGLSFSMSPILILIIAIVLILILS